MIQVYLGADHAGYTLKESVRTYLKKKGFAVTDLGVFSTDPSDYPDIAREVAEKVYEQPNVYGVLICGTGIGMCMVANKYPNTRAALCTSPQMAEMARRHNNANVLCLGGRLQSLDDVQPVIDAFFAAAFEGGRHEQRIAKFEKHWKVEKKPQKKFIERTTHPVDSAVIRLQEPRGRYRGKKH